MAETHDTIDGLLAEFRGYSAGMPPSYHVTMSWADFRKMLDRLEEAHRRKITILLDALAEVVASIEVRFPAIEYAIDRKPYLDAKKILEQYKEEAALATTSNQNTQEEH